MNNGDKTFGGFTGIAEGGWPLSDMRAWLNSEEFISSLDPALQVGLKTVLKVSDQGRSSYYEAGDTKAPLAEPVYVNSADKIFIPSTTELNLTYGLTGANQGATYPMFTNNQSRATGFDYFTRSTATSSGLGNIFAMVRAAGDVYPVAGSAQKQIVFCLCI